jgi:hypothetical protein
VGKPPKPKETESKVAKSKEKKNGGRRAPSVGGVVMTFAVASAFVSVGIWIAQDFFGVKVPAQLAAPLATILVWIVGIGRAIAIAIAAILYGIFWGS